MPLVPEYQTMLDALAAEPGPPITAMTPEEASAPSTLNVRVSGSRSVPRKARTRRRIGHTPSGRNAARGAPAATRRARPQTPIRVVAAPRRMARYAFGTAPRIWTLADALTRIFRVDGALGKL